MPEPEFLTNILHSLSRIIIITNSYTELVLFQIIKSLDSFILKTVYYYYTNFMDEETDT